MGCDEWRRELASGVGHEPVYNIEVEGDHCYRVGDQGILVHNQSTPCVGAFASPGSQRVSFRNRRIYLRRELNARRSLVAEFPIPSSLIANLQVRTGGTRSGPGSIGLLNAYYIHLSSSEFDHATGAILDPALVVMVPNPHHLAAPPLQQLHPSRRFSVGFAGLPGIGGLPGMPADSVGHVLGYQFGGLGGFMPIGSGLVPYIVRTDGRGNIVPQNASVNNNLGRDFEGRVLRRAVDRAGRKCNVCLRIRYLYNDAAPLASHPFRPTHLIIDWWYGRSHRRLPAPYVNPIANPI